MGDNMPYAYEKGPFWSIYDGYFSGVSPVAGTPSALIRKLNTLADLHRVEKFTQANPELNMTPFVNAGVIHGIRTNTQAIHHGQIQPGWTSRQVWDFHVDAHWLGRHPVTGAAPPAPPFPAPAPPPPNLPPSTGWWAGWSGDAEGIARVAVIRAIEVSLGLPSIAVNLMVPPGSGAPALSRQDVLSNYQVGGGTLWDVYVADAIDPSMRNWPIEFVWICPVPHFEAAVSWQGQTVKVTWMTPGAQGHDMQMDDINVPIPNCTIGDGGVPNPSQGVWLVNQKHRRMVRISSALANKPGVINGSLAYNTSHDEVVTVQPTPYQGGAYPNGLPY